MKAHRTRIGLGLVTLGTLALLAVSGPASAGQRTTSSVQATKGSDPGAPICKFSESARKAALKNSTLETKDMTSNNWAGAKKIILADFKSEAKELKTYQGAINSLPSSIKAAEQLELKEFPNFQKQVEKIDSLAQFYSKASTLAPTGKYAAAAKTVENYTIATCGSAAE